MQPSPLTSLRNLLDDRRRLRWLMLLAIPLLSVPVWWPLTSAGFPKTHDASVHLMRLYLIDQQIAGGDLFPRWLPDLFLGYGYPVLDFYAPAIYYAAQLIALLPFDFLQSFAVMIAVASVVAGWGMYLLARDLFADDRDARGEWAGLVAAVAYMYTPYFLVNIYVRGALAEMMAQALLPFVFWGAYRVFTAPTPLPYAVITTIAITLLALTHNITLLFLPPLLLAYILVIIWQQRTRDWRPRLLWFVGVGLVAAMASAFFWLPVLVERSFLAPSTFEMGAELHLHTWTWQTWLESRVPYPHDLTGVPFRLGLVQVVLGGIGLVLVGRRRPLWWYWVAWGAVGILAVTAWAIPLWNSVGYLQLAQFPWRLLTIISMSLALLTGGIVTAFNRNSIRLLTVAVVATVMIVGNAPEREPYDGNVYADVEINDAVIARYESVRGAYGAGWHREFLPVWSQGFDDEIASAATAPEEALQIRLLETGATGLTVATSSPVSSTLRLNQFYFPGWTAELDGRQPLAVGPSTQRGVVTVEVPAGEHMVQFAWRESSIQRMAEWITVGGLCMLVLFLLWRRRWWLAAGTTVVCLLAALVLLKPPATVNRAFVATDMEVAPGLRLIGYRTEQSAGGRHLLVTPYWHVASPQMDMQLRWKLLDENGAERSSIKSMAYFNALSFASIAPGTVMRDGYRLELPWSQPERTYRLQVQPTGDGVPNIAPTKAGNVTVAPTPKITPLRLLMTDLQSNDQAWLDGYTLSINGAPVDLTATMTPPVIRAGDVVEYVLYWRAQGEISEDYHSFMHVVDAERQVLVSLDKVPGTEISRPILWDDYHTERDTFAFQAPADAAGGLYYPRIGLYDFSDLDRFLIESADGVQIGDGFDLPPLKIVSASAPQPQQKLSVQYGDFAELLGFDLARPGASVQPGEVLTLTVYYRSTRSTPVDFTQFFQLYDPGLGMAAQLDQPPLAGGNPTSSWTPGEVIVDQVLLTVRPDAAPGRYSLNTGMYDPLHGGARVDLSAKDAGAFADNQAPLIQVQVDVAQE